VRSSQNPDPTTIDEALLEESATDLYENAPCGYLSTRPDGTIVKVNETFLTWTGHRRDEILGQRFPDLLTAGGRIYHETHYAPLLRMQGRVHGIALEIVRADGGRLPVLVNSMLRTDPAGEPLLIRTTIFDATDRKEYERELLRARDRERAAYEREREVAQTLQHALLAGDPPDGARFTIATHYSPGVETLAVGGDWHDAFCIGSDRLGIVVGDVVGRGLAAATAMGQLRSAVRALACADLKPATLLERLDSFVAHVEASHMATVAYAEIDLQRGVARYACAGHPPPALVQPDEDPRLLWDGRSAPLGIPHGGSERTDAELALHDGARLLLFTDGLVERRDQPLDDGLDRLLAELAVRRRSPLPALIEEIPRAMLAGAPSDDDVCLLGFSFEPS
jgi:phosphoserine phosphatase RsbU/P